MSFLLWALLAADPVAQSYIFTWRYDRNAAIQVIERSGLRIVHLGDYMDIGWARGYLTYVELRFLREHPYLYSIATDPEPKPDPKMVAKAVAEAKLRIGRERLQQELDKVGHGPFSKMKRKAILKRAAQMGVYPANR